MLDVWNREARMPFQENRLLLGKASVLITQKAYGFIGQAIKRTLQYWRFGDIQSEDGDLGRDPRGASADEKRVSVLEYPSLTRLTQQVTYRASMY